MIAGCSVPRQRTNQESKPQIQNVPAPITTDGVSENWAKMSGDRGNTFFAPFTLPDNLVLRHNPLRGGETPLSVMNGHLFTVDKRDRNRLHAVDLATNTIKWTFDAGGTGNSINEIVAAQGTIYVMTLSGLFAIHDTGSQFTTKWTSNSLGNRITFDESNLYFWSNQNEILALDKGTGARKWAYPLGAMNQLNASMIATGGGQVYFLAQNIREMVTNLFALNTTTGQVNWTFPVYGNSSGNPVFSDGKVYFDLSSSGKTYIQALNATTGASGWKFDLRNSFTKFPNQGLLAVNQSSVFALNRSGELVAVNKGDGTEQWRVKYAEVYVSGGTQTDSTSDGATIVTMNHVILENHGKIKIYDTSNGTMVRSLTPVANFTPLAIGSGLLVGTDGNQLYSYGPVEAGTDTTKPTASLTIPGTGRVSPYEGSQRIDLSFFLSESATVQMVIRNEAGQSVRSFSLGVVESGWREQAWDARNDQGSPVPNGRYTVAFTLRDLAGNENVQEDQSKGIVVGDIFGTLTRNTNLRKGPGTGYEVVRVVPVGSRVTILGESGDWYHVEYAGSDVTNTGYVAKYLVTTRSTIVTPAPAPQPTTPTLIVHVVVAGDTLWKISVKYGVTVEAILKANGLSASSYLYVGQKLAIPTGKEPTPQPTTVTHTVQSGDTLWLLAQRYGTTVSNLITWNNLGTNTTLNVGQKLIVKK